MGHWFHAVLKHTENEIIKALSNLNKIISYLVIQTDRQTATTTDKQTQLTSFTGMIIRVGVVGGIAAVLISHEAFCEYTNKCIFVRASLPFHSSGGEGGGGGEVGCMG